MLLLRASLLFFVTVVVLPTSTLGYERATGPRLENLTETEAKYAKLYWSYKPADRILNGQRKPGKGPYPRLGYRFAVPLPERLAGITYMGHAARLRVVLERARNGEALMIGALGGSITFGQAVGGWEGSYVKTFVDWLNAALPPRERSAEGAPHGATSASGGGAAGGPPVTSGAGGGGGGEGAGAGGAGPAGDAGRPHRQLSADETEAGALRPGAADQEGQNVMDMKATGASAILEQRMQGRAAEHDAAGGSVSVGGSSGGRSAGDDSSDGEGRGGGGGGSDWRGRGAVGFWRQLEENSAAAPRAAADAPIAVLVPGSPGLAPAAAAATTEMRAAATAEVAYRERGRAGSGRAHHHDFFNGAVPGTTSAYMSSCMHHHLPPGVDLVLVEYAVNDPANPKYLFGDPSRRGFERLIRKLLRLPSRPAVVLVNMFAFGSSHGRYQSTAERDLMEFATYYSLPAVSLKAAVLPSAAVGGAEQVSHGAIFNGGHNHPGRGGHVVVVELLITIFLDLLRSNDNGRWCDPWIASTDDDDDDNSDDASGDGDDALETDRGPPQSAVVAKMEAVAARPLPHPLAEGNYESEGSTCYIEHELRGLALRPLDGWNWTDEGRDKWGWVATAASKTLKFKVSTRLVGYRPQQQAEAEIILQVAYLQSYEGMGSAELSCEEGCKCSPVTIDGYDRRPVSVTAMKDIQVSQHPECVIALTTRGPSKAAREAAAKAAGGGGAKEGESDAGGGGGGSGSGATTADWNKFKVLGVVVGEEPGAAEGGVTWVRNESHTMAQVMRQMGRGRELLRGASGDAAGG